MSNELMAARQSGKSKVNEAFRIAYFAKLKKLTREYYSKPREMSLRRYIRIRTKPANMRFQSALRGAMASNTLERTPHNFNSCNTKSCPECADCGASVVRSRKKKNEERRFKQGRPCPKRTFMKIQRELRANG